MPAGKRKVILTCAVTGNAPVNPKYPYEYPVTPTQICDAVAEAANAGASIVHIHVRDPETGGGSRDPKLFREVVDRIRDKGVDIVINLTAGLGAFFLPDPEDEGRALPESDVISVEERVAHLKDCLPEIASLDVTTGNQVEGPTEFVYLNTGRVSQLHFDAHQDRAGRNSGHGAVSGIGCRAACNRAAHRRLRQYGVGNLEYPRERYT